MRQRLSDKLNARLEAALPEKRLFLKSDDGTRFVRLRPATQAGVLAGGALLVGWTAVVTAFFLIGAIASDSAREQAATAQFAYESRLGTLAAERDSRASEAEAAVARFYTALEEVSKMQEALLAAEQRNRELETGIEAVQRNLRRTLQERDAARADMAEAEARLADAPEAVAEAERLHADSAAMSAALARVLDETARARDEARAFAAGADGVIDRMRAEADARSERNDAIFRRLEAAVEVSLEPLDKVFERSGISTDAIIREVRSGYDGQGGPIEPLISTRGDPAGIADEDTARANRLLGRLEEVDLYRMAAESLPLANPVPGPYRQTSGFGPRWGRMHSGLDFAGPRGSRIEAAAAGTVIHAGWQSGYGKLVKIRHPMGFETRYAHLNSIDVAVGQRVSRGERIGGMGTTGRSTGVHLHYEIRRGGKALNPATFLNAGQDVF